MSNSSKAVLALFLILLYNIIVLAGISYVVFVLGASGWWFLLALLLLQRNVNIDWKEK